MTFGEKLLDLRRKNGMSQDTLADQLGVSRQAVSKWERDEAVPETDKIIRIARLFHVSTDYLLLDGPEAEAPAPEPRSAPSVLDRMLLQVERLVRRHGYKFGYVISGIGAAFSAIILGLRAWWLSSVQSMGDLFQGAVGDMNNLHSSALGNLGMPDMGNGMFDTVIDNSQIMMDNAATSGANLLLIGLIPGVLLIAAGIFVVVYGKKLSKQESAQ